jgi:hypothetical protein
MRNIIMTSAVDPFFYLWDPHLGSVGGWQVFSVSGGNYVPIPGGGSYGAGVFNYIQSGLAFFVHASGLATVTIKENSKTNINTNAVFKTGRVERYLRTNLYLADSGISTLLDGVLCKFNANGKDRIDRNDAEKMNNFSESIGIMRENKLLMVEERKGLDLADTIFYNTSQMGKKDYILEFVAEGLDRPGRTAFLEDVYTGIRNKIELDGMTRIGFKINDEGSGRRDRFRVVIGEGEVVLNCDFRLIK